MVSVLFIKYMVLVYGKCLIYQIYGLKYIISV